MGRGCLMPRFGTALTFSTVDAHLSWMSKGMASLMTNSHQMMMHTAIRPTDRKSTTCQLDLK